MKRALVKLTLPLAAALLLFVGTTVARADHYCPAPAVSYYYAPPVVTYSSPVVSYYPAPVATYSVPRVSYYAAPAVSYYPAPTVSYYAAPSYSYYPGAAAVTTTNYGLFGRPKSTTTYYAPVMIGN